MPYLKKRMLYQFQWGYRKEGRSPAEYREWAKDEFRPVLRRMLDIAIRKEILVPQAAYGYWRCAAEGNDVILFDTDGERELTGSHSRARTRKAGSASPISSTMRPTGGRDVIALQVVTMGRRASRANGSPKTAIRITSIGTASRSRWPRPCRISVQAHPR